MLSIRWFSISFVAPSVYRYWARSGSTINIVPRFDWHSIGSYVIRAQLKGNAGRLIIFDVTTVDFLGISGSESSTRIFCSVSKNRKGGFFALFLDHHQENSLCFGLYFTITVIYRIFIEFYLKNFVISCKFFWPKIQDVEIKKTSLRAYLLVLTGLNVDKHILTLLKN